MSQSSPSAELLTVLIPCRNEESGVVETVRGVLAERLRLPLRLEVVLIDDGSSDDTARRMREICEVHPECRMVRNEKNLGVGRSILNTYDSLDPHSWVTVVPGDNEIVFASIYRYLEVRANSDIILGYLQNPVIRPIARRFASHLFTVVVSLLFGFGYRYLNGMKMYRVRAFQGLEVVSGGHAFNAELLAKAILRDPTLRITEVPFMARGRAHGSTKAFRPGSILRALTDVVRGAASVATFRQKVIQMQVKS